MFEDIGRAYCIGLLDFIDKNPISRIPLSPFKDLEGIKADILSKNPIFIPSKKRSAVREAGEVKAKQLLRAQST